jgi:predicted KAP-like P-loop ATPase
MKHVKNNLPDNWKVIWFDAWEYERLDPTLALMQRIADQYHTKADKFKRVIKGILRLSSDMFLRTATGLELEQVEKEFEDTVRSIPTINEELSKLVGDGRLVVFIDDLDRCIVENALSILEAISSS